jgi:hypothetical protein
VTAAHLLQHPSSLQSRSRKRRPGGHTQLPPGSWHMSHSSAHCSSSRAQQTQTVSHTAPPPLALQQHGTTDMGKGVTCSQHHCVITLQQIVEQPQGGPVRCGAWGRYLDAFTDTMRCCLTQMLLYAGMPHTLLMCGMWLRSCQRALQHKQCYFQACGLLRNNAVARE